MFVFRCKMCDGTLELDSTQTVAECEYCHTKQTLPKLNDEKRANLYDRANHFRYNNEFDKAMMIYENILNEDTTDAEAYWSLVLCRYGIEYVEDPVSHKRVPTVNRAQYVSVLDDDNYKSALSYADISQRHIYEEEAKTINEIQKGILEISQKEQPFDVFICYKETDSNGRRTPDSVLANDLYHQLTQEGYRVFFSRITLEDKLGVEYEPYIFAALNSAKVMVVLGTKPEYFNAVWVKNEWSRYLTLIRQGQKKILIPAYRDMDAYDLPDAFSHLQAQDMSKLGFMQDLIRGINKITQASSNSGYTAENRTGNNINNINVNIDALIKRVFMFLEDGEFAEAKKYCERILDMNPECPEAYLGKMLVEYRLSCKEELQNMIDTFEDSNDYRKILRFGDDKLKAELNEYISKIKENKEIHYYNVLYESAKNSMDLAKTESEYRDCAKEFEKISEWKDSAELAAKCYELADECDKAKAKDDILNEAKCEMASKTNKGYSTAIYLFSKIPGWKDADEQKAFCEAKLEDIRKLHAEQERIRAQMEYDESSFENKASESFALKGILAIIVVAIIISIIIANI